VLRKLWKARALTGHLMNARPLKSTRALSGHKIAAVSISHPACRWQPAFNAELDTKPRVHFDATMSCASARTRARGRGVGDRMLGFEGHESLSSARIRSHSSVTTGCVEYRLPLWPLLAAGSRAVDLAARSRSALLELLAAFQTGACLRFIGDAARSGCPGGRRRALPCQGFPPSSCGFTAATGTVKRWKRCVRGLARSSSCWWTATRGGACVDTDAAWSLKDALACRPRLERLKVY